jgi:hypothetical protein
MIPVDDSLDCVIYIYPACANKLVHFNVNIFLIFLFLPHLMKVLVYYHVIKSLVLPETWCFTIPKLYHVLGFCQLKDWSFILDVTIPELHHYLGFCQLKGCSFILDVAQPNISFHTTDVEVTLELRGIASITWSQHITTPLECPLGFLDVAHCDIWYGDCKAASCAHYCFLFIGHSTLYCQIYAL